MELKPKVPSKILNKWDSVDPFGWVTCRDTKIPKRSPPKPQPTKTLILTAAHQFIIPQIKESTRKACHGAGSALLCLCRFINYTSTTYSEEQYMK